MTARIPPVDPEIAPDDARDALDRVCREVGALPNLYAAMAVSPASLRGFLDLRAALATGRLPSALQVQLALLVAEENASRYCVAVHMLGGERAGVARGELAANRRGKSADSRTAAALSFAAAVLDGRGHVTDAELARARASGFDDGEITEVIAHVALNCMANFFCQVACPAVDAPVVPLTTDTD